MLKYDTQDTHKFNVSMGRTVIKYAHLILAVFVQMTNSSSHFLISGVPGLPLVLEIPQNCSIVVQG